MKKIILTFLVFFLLLGITNGQSLVEMRATKNTKLDFVTFFDDFESYLHPVDTTGIVDSLAVNSITEYGWEITTVGASEDTCVDIIDGMNGILKLTPASADNDGAGFQWNAEIFDCDTNVTTGYRPLTLGMYVKLGEARESDFIGGLSITDSDLTDGSSDGIYFFKQDTKDSVLCITIRNSAGDTTVVDDVFSDSTWVRLDIDWNGRNRVTFRVDNAIVATHTTVSLLPADELLTQTFGFWNGQAVAEVFWIDYFYVSQARKE